MLRLLGLLRTGKYSNIVRKGYFTYSEILLGSNPYAR